MPKFILQDNGTECNNNNWCLCSTLSIKCIYNNPYHPKGNGRIESIHNLLKCTITKFTYGSQLEWDDMLPLATYCYNIASSVDDLEPPFYLVHGRDLLEGRLRNLQNYCRYMGDQSEQPAIQQLRKMWKLHAKLLAENRSIKPAANKQVTKACNLRVGQLVFVKDNQKYFQSILCFWS